MFRGQERTPVGCIHSQGDSNVAKRETVIEIDEPTMMVFDLDPGPPADIVLCCQVAFWLRDIFDRFKLKAFAKTSGSKGLQIYVPLNTPVTYDETKAFSHALARLLEQEHADL